MIIVLSDGVIEVKFGGVHLLRLFDFDGLVVLDEGAGILAESVVLGDVGVGLGHVEVVRFGVEEVETVWRGLVCEGCHIELLSEFRLRPGFLL